MAEYAMETLVSCLICGHSAVTLARHLKAAHGVTAEDYRSKYLGARIRSEACEANRKAAFIKAHAKKPKKGLKKTIFCSVCRSAREVGFTFAASVHDSRCDTCRLREEAEAEEAKWIGKTIEQDYAVCQGCGHKAENLTSHIQSAHPEWVGCYPGQIVAFTSAVRDKSALKSKPLSDVTRHLMSERAGRWNKGLTKETDARLAAAADHQKGRIPWSKGLTKEDHPSLAQTSEKLQTYRGLLRTWDNGLKVNLSEVDFTPYLDETGAVDRKAMSEAMKISEVTITKYMKDVGFRLSNKYVDARIERQIVKIEKEHLLPYALGNGKIAVGQAMLGLGHGFHAIKRECQRHKLKTFTRNIRQSLFLDTLATLLNAPYVQEWKSWSFVNPKSGHRFRFDGYFPSHNLVVEFHGYQHWVFPSVYVKTQEMFEALQERDRVKKEMIEADPVLRYFEVRESEPYTDRDYLTARLLDEGVTDPGK